MRKRYTEISSQTSNATQKENVARIWSLLLRSYFTYFLPPKSFYLATFSNLLRPPYTKQNNLPNIDIYLGSKKLVIDFLSLFFLDFLTNIIFLSSTSRRNNTKEKNNFNHFKLSI